MSMSGCACAYAPAPLYSPVKITKSAGIIDLIAVHLIQRLSISTIKLGTFVEVVLMFKPCYM